MKRIFCLLLIAAPVWTFATGLSPSSQVSNEEFIQGIWRIVGYANQEKRLGRWELEWTFKEGKFKQTGYPRLAQSGSYRVLSNDGDKLTLELYQQQGTFGSKDRRIEIVVYRTKDQLKIERHEPFLRVKPKS